MSPGPGPELGLRLGPPGSGSVSLVRAIPDGAQRNKLPTPHSLYVGLGSDPRGWMAQPPPKTSSDRCPRAKGRGRSGQQDPGWEGGGHSRGSTRKARVPRSPSGSRSAGHD